MAPNDRQWGIGNSRGGFLKTYATEVIIALFPANRTPHYPTRHEPHQRQGENVTAFVGVHTRSFFCV
jgi:hypothetical protein